MTDWLRAEEEADLRRCANPEWIGCVMLILSLVGGIVLGWLGYLWVSVCP